MKIILAVILLALIAGPSWAVDIRDSCKFDGSDCDSTDGGWNSSDTFEEWGANATARHSGSCHFDDVQVPQGATITSAVIKWKPVIDGGSINMKIYAKDADSPDTATTEGPDNDDEYFANPDGAGISFTSTSVDYDDAGSTANVWETTEDFGSVVQEIVNRSGWSSGNSLCIMLMDDGTTPTNLAYPYTFDHVEQGDSCAPKLLISYTTATAGTHLGATHIRKTAIGQ